MIYHIFTHNTDEYTTDKIEAYKIYRDFIKENDSARLYEKESEYDDGNCIDSYGEYPQ